MQDTSGPIAPSDPWSTNGLPFMRLWPLYAGIAAGASLAVIALIADRPTLSFLPVLVIAGAIAGAIASAFVPSGERSARFLDVAYPALLAGVSSRFFGAIGLVVTGRDPSGEAISTILLYFFVMVFFVGFPLLIAKLFQSPARRLPDEVLAQIGEPYPTRRVPRLVTIRVADGTTHRASVLRGGFVAGLAIPFDPATATGVAGDKVVPSGPKQIKATRAAAREQTEAKVAAKRKARADAKTARGGDTDDPPPGTSGRPAPAPTSRTTPKGTSGKAKGPKR